jgi:DNA-binding NtrC family response regulator
VLWHPRCIGQFSVGTARTSRLCQRWILIADADGDSASRLVSHFVRQGLRAYHAARGEEALLLAHSRQIGAAVIDVTLADMQGTTLAARLKAIEPDLPVVMTSADHRPETEVEARRLGILYFAHKPVSDRLIGGVVQKALSPTAPPAIRSQVLEA